MSDAPGVTVEVAAAVTPELVEAAHRLVPQLSSSAAAPSEDELDEILRSPACTLFLARDRDGDGGIIGMLTLVTYRIPTGVNAVIEDVVVDGAARGAGAGAALVQAALDEAARRRVRHVDLTSRPSRESANRLYQKMGFSVRDTNVYRRPMP
jgi:ribosomal protein S18 acetylase RimI-like enzyme